MKDYTCTINVLSKSKWLEVAVWVLGEVKVYNTFSYPNVLLQCITASTLRPKGILLILINNGKLWVF